MIGYLCVEYKEFWFFIISQPFLFSLGFSGHFLSTFELERRLKMKVDEVGLLLLHLYEYNSVCFLKPATPLRFSGRWNGRLFLVLKTHAIWHKPKEKAFPLKEGRRGYIAHSKHFTFKVTAGEEQVSRAVYVPFYSNKIKDKQEKQLTHTYRLIEAKIFMEATKWNKEKIGIIRWQLLGSFFRVFLSV